MKLHCYLLSILFLLFSSFSCATSGSLSRPNIIEEDGSGKFFIIYKNTLLYWFDSYQLLPCTSSITCDEFEVYLGDAIDKGSLKNKIEISRFITDMTLNTYKSRSKEDTVLTLAPGDKEVVPASFYLYQIGRMYFNGLGITADNQEGIKWYKLAANEGSANAQFELGVLYHEGKWVVQDESMSAKWYLKAAKQGLPKAQYNLAVKYERGNGVGKNNKEAVKWYLKAAKQGIPEAQYNLGLLFFNAKKDVEAYQWLISSKINDVGEDIEDKLQTVSMYLSAAQISFARKLAFKCINSKYADCNIVNIEAAIAQFNSSKLGYAAGNYLRETASFESLKKSQCGYMIKEKYVFENILEEDVLPYITKQNKDQILTFLELKSFKESLLKDSVAIKEMITSGKSDGQSKKTVCTNLTTSFLANYHKVQKNWDYAKKYYVKE